MAVQWGRDGKTKYPYLDFEGGSTVEGCWDEEQMWRGRLQKADKQTSGGVSGTQPMSVTVSGVVCCPDMG